MHTNVPDHTQNLRKKKVGDGFQDLTRCLRQYWDQMNI